MARNRVRTLAAIGVIISLALAAVIAMSSTNSGTLLVNTYDQSPSVFRFKYPAGWQYRIILQNLLMLAQNATFEGNPGPTVTIQRSFPLSASASLQEALDTYLNEGPLREDRDWDIIGEINRITFDGRDALSVDFEGRETPENPELHTRVVITKANNGFVYVFAASAPIAEWDTHQPVFDAILDSVEIIE
jgi:hypothetical protein